jgi:hypothetical protein
MHPLLLVIQENFLTTSDLFNQLSGTFLARLSLDLASVWILVRFIYFQVYKTRDLFFTFIIFNLVIFLISYSLNRTEISMGAAFGLFAVFSMLRYRTEDISIKDMTYLFLCIALGVLTAVSTGGWQLQIAISATILGITYLLESKWLFKKESAKIIFYDQIALVSKEKEAELIADLRLKTGLPVHRVQIQKLDFVRDSAQLRVFYYEAE